MGVSSKTVDIQTTIVPYHVPTIFNQDAHITECYTGIKSKVIIKPLPDYFLFLLSLTQRISTLRVVLCIHSVNIYHATTIQLFLKKPKLNREAIYI